MSEELTWTEIAIQLTGEVPVSCKSHMGGMEVTLADGKKKRFTAKQVDDAIEDLDEIAKSSETGPAAAAESKPTAAAKAKPATGSKPKSKSKAGKAKK